MQQRIVQGKDLNRGYQMSRMLLREKESQAQASKLIFVPKANTINKSQFDKVYQDLLGEKTMNIIAGRAERKRGAANDKELGKFLESKKLGAVKSMTEKEFIQATSLANTGVDRRAIMKI